MKSYIVTPKDKLWDTLCSMDDLFNQEIIPQTNYLLCGILVELNGEFCARAVCYHNPYHVLDGKDCMSFGYLYCKEDISIFRFLSNAILEVASSSKFDKVLGPMNGSTWNDYRLVSSMQEHPFLLEPVNAPHLSIFFEQEWDTLANYQSSYSDSIEVNWTRVMNRYEDFISQGIKFMDFDKARSTALFVELAEFCNISFEKNFLFSPLDTDDFVAKMNKVLPIIDPRLTVIARNKNGEIIGFIFAYEDLLNPDKKTLVVKTLARLPSKRYAGIGSVLMSLVMKQAKELGFESSIHALMINTNTSNFVSSKFNGESFRKYSLYSKKSL